MRARGGGAGEEKGRAVCGVEEGQVTQGGKATESLTWGNGGGRVQG